MAQAQTQKEKADDEEARPLERNGRLRACVERLRMAFDGCRHVVVRPPGACGYCAAGAAGAICASVGAPDAGRRVGVDHLAGLRLGEANWRAI